MKRLAEIFNRSDGAGVEMRLPGAVRATGVGTQLQGGASGVCETHGSHRAVAGGLGKGLAEKRTAGNARKIYTRGNGVLPRQPTVICRLSVPRYLNRDVVSDLFRALNFSGDVSGPVLLVDGRDKSAQLNRAIERFHLYPIELIFDVLSQRSVDADRSVLIVNSLASGLLVATLGGGRGGDGWWSRAAGHAQKQWHCADAEDQRQPLKRSARVYRCVFHISSCVFDVGLFTD